MRKFNDCIEENDIESAVSIGTREILKGKVDKRHVFGLINFMAQVGAWPQISLIEGVQNDLLSRSNWRALRLLNFKTYHPGAFLDLWAEKCIDSDLLSVLQAVNSTGDYRVVERIFPMVIELLTHESFRAFRDQNLPAIITQLERPTIKTPLLSAENRIKFYTVMDPQSPEARSKVISLMFRWGDDGIARQWLQSLDKDAPGSKMRFEQFWGPLNIKSVIDRAQTFEWITSPANQHFSPEVELVTVVYGQQYCGYFEHICIPSITSALEFKDLVTSSKTCWTIYTTPQSLDFLRVSLAYLQSIGLTVRINTSLLYSDSIAAENRGFAWQASLQRSAKTGCTLAQITPDAFYGNGLLSMINACPSSGAIGPHHLRVFDKSFLKDAKGILESNVEHRNNLMIGVALSSSSLFWHRAGLFRRDTRSPERQLQVVGECISHSHACPVSVVVNCDQDLYDSIDREAPWLYGRRTDRWLNATDHYIPWRLSREGRFKVCRSAEEFFFLEMNHAQGYLNTLKNRRGLYPDERFALKNLFSVWDLQKIRESMSASPCEPKKPYHFLRVNSFM